ncbi:hypothetical protein K523DRAFT_406741 [Schizophyllum commune Tattone D]|nr:hypothetical protein K523DRAFT_406741 [Schizophyllum commune Tattone D]
MDELTRSEATPAGPRPRILEPQVLEAPRPIPRTPTHLVGQELAYASGSDPGVANSSIPRGPEDRQRKGHKKRRNTFARKREDKEEREQREHEAEARAKVTAFEAALDILARNSIPFGELLLYVLDPKGKRSRGWRWNNLFKDPSTIRQALEWMALTKRNSHTARSRAVDAVLNVTTRLLSNEAKAITQSGSLRPPSTVDKEFVLGYKFASLPRRIREFCPLTLRVLSSVTTTTRQLRECTQEKLAHKKFVTAAYAALLLGEHSRENSYFRHIFGLYLYASGASRQLITVLNHLGVSVSYVTLAGRGGKSLAWDGIPTPSQDVEATADSPSMDVDSEAAEVSQIESDAADGNISVASGSQTSASPAVIPVKRKTRVLRLGTLEKLSLSMRELTRELVANHAFLIVYDNINMSWKVAEQIIGRTDAVESGTCSTVVLLHGGEKPSDMRTEDLDRALSQAPPLSIDDIRLTKEEVLQREEYLVHTVLRLAIRYGGPGLERFRQRVIDSQPASSHVIPVHTSDVHPLPAYPIDESSKQGNAEFISAAMTELKYENRADVVRLVAGDQLSMARLREVAAARAGHEGGPDALRWPVFVPGFFHYQMAAVNAIIHAHLGSVNHDVSNPASLQAHNTLLRRKPIVATSLPPYHVLKGLAFDSLGARILDCFLRVSGKASLDAFCKDLTWQELNEYAREVVRQFADARVVHKLRRAREKDGKDSGDMVFENAVLFIRDGLLLREFNDAIKAGDSGRIILVLKTWAFSFRAQGRSRYATEILYLIHNLTHVWPPAIREAVLSNWLVNPSGKPNANHPVDLLQEHNNLLTKVHYEAHGSNASWEWTATMAPCVTILRQLNNDVNQTLGARQGKRHATPDLTADIDELMNSLSHRKVHEIQLGRTLEADDSMGMVPDAVAIGHTQLTYGATSPLKKYNEAFLRLQKRRRVAPLVPRREPSPSASQAASGQAEASSPRSTEQLPDDGGSTLANVDPKGDVLHVEDLGDEAEAEDMEVEGNEDGSYEEEDDVVEEEYAFSLDELGDLLEEGDDLEAVEDLESEDYDTDEAFE